MPMDNARVWLHGTQNMGGVVSRNGQWETNQLRFGIPPVTVVFEGNPEPISADTRFDLILDDGAESHPLYNLAVNQRTSVWPRVEFYDAGDETSDSED